MGERAKTERCRAHQKSSPVHGLPPLIAAFAHGFSNRVEAEAKMLARRCLKE
jgi:hypothetical protein